MTLDIQAMEKTYEMLQDMIPEDIVISEEDVKKRCKRKNEVRKIIEAAQTK